MHMRCVWMDETNEYDIDTLYFSRHVAAIAPVPVTGTILDGATGTLSGTFEPTKFVTQKGSYIATTSHRNHIHT